jgi:hypothetical protein
MQERFSLDVADSRTLIPACCQLILFLCMYVNMLPTTLLMVCRKRLALGRMLSQHWRLLAPQKERCYVLGVCTEMQERFLWMWQVPAPASAALNAKNTQCFFRLLLSAQHMLLLQEMQERFSLDVAGACARISSIEYE